jgi:hypothetical protein
MPEFDFLLDIGLFRKGLSEQKRVINDFWDKAKAILQGSGIHLKSLPKSWITLRHNHFSVLFIVFFFILDIPIHRLRFFAGLNHCLRSWVTACDNLLDRELKEIVVTDLPEQAYTFKSVHTLLLTDRIFFSFLLDAVKSGTITENEMIRLLNISLSAISDSGREEAEEEGGITDSLPPEKVLNRIHYYKTGKLFTAPLVAPLALGDIDIKNRPVKQIRHGLTAFGLGCQILDDLSDLGMDMEDNKHNYVASLILHGQSREEKERFLELRSGHPVSNLRSDYKLYKQFPRASQKALQETVSQLHSALELFAMAGLPLTTINREAFIKVLVKVFGHPDRLLNLRER